MVVGQPMDTIKIRLQLYGPDKYKGIFIFAYIYMYIIYKSITYVAMFIHICIRVLSCALVNTGD